MRFWRSVSTPASRAFSQTSQTSGTSSALMPSAEAGGLQKRNPKDDKGKREGRHHQLLTPDLGLPALQNHLFATTKFMGSRADMGPVLPIYATGPS
jgi:hypothetical protein